MKSIKVVLNDGAPLDMGFENNKVYRVIPFKGDSGIWFYRLRKRYDKGGLWLQSYFSVVYQSKEAE